MVSLPTLAADPLAPLVGAFRRHYPGIRIDLAAPDDASELFRLVASGTCELGVTEAHGMPESLQSHPLRGQSLVLILPPGTDHAEGDRLDLSSLEGMPFVVAPRGTSTFRLLEEGFAAVQRSPTVAVVTAQRDAIVPLVIAGAGAALVPESVARTASGLGAVMARPQPPIERAIALIHRSGPLSPAARRFTEMAVAP